MNKWYTVSFFGHRQINSYKEIYEPIYELALKLLRKNEYTELLIGKNGAFDETAAGAIRAARDAYGDYNSSLTLVLPYCTAEFEKNEDAYYERYSDVEIFNSTHFKSAIRQRNQYMIDRSDLVVFYLTESYGGAYNAYKYAKKQHKKILNISQRWLRTVGVCRYGVAD